MNDLDSETKQIKMKYKAIMAALMAVALSALSANAWHLNGVVSCPSGNSFAGIIVTINGVGSTNTSGNGAYLIDLPDSPGTYTVCVDASSLPAGVTVSGCATFSVDDNTPYATVDFTLNGSFCGTPPSVGPYWLTGGGTIGKTK